MNMCMLSMTRDEMLELIKKYPYKKVTHCSFAPNEYIYADYCGRVYTEEDYVFEDWNGNHDGLRIRVGGGWETDWSLYDPDENEKYNKDKVNRALEILDKLEFFGGQRAGRELWYEKPYHIQEQDLADFRNNIATVKDVLVSIHD